MAARPLRLLRLDIEGFGCLSGSFPFESEKVNLIVAPNEEGKSTLAHAIQAVLYGVERDRRKARSGLLELDRFRPWRGGAYAASLEIERDGERFQIRRDFERGELWVRDGAGRDVTRDYTTKEGDEAGEKLIGLTRGEFERTVFSGHDEKPLKDAAELTGRLQSIASAERGATPDAARTALQSALDVYAPARMGKKLKVENEIKRLEESLARAAEQIREIESQRANLHASFQEIESRREKIRALDEERAREQYLALRGDLAEAEATLKAEETRAEELRKLTERRDTLHDAANFPAAQAESLTALRTQINGHRETIRSKSEERHALEVAIEGARRRLAELGPAGEASADDRVRVVRMREKLIEIADESEAAVREHMDEKQKLAQKGIDPAELERLESAFAPLTAEDRAMAASEEEFRRTVAAERREAQDAADRARLTAEGVRRGRSETRWWGVVLILVGAAMCGISFLASPPGRWAALALGGLLLLAGIAVFAASFSRGSDTLATARREAEETARTLAELDERTGEHDKAAAALIERTGHPDPIELSRAYAKWLAAQTEIRDFYQSDRRLKSAGEASKDVLAEAAGVAVRWGAAADGEKVGERMLADLAGVMKQAESAREENTRIERDLARVAREISDEEGRQGTAAGSLVELLRGAGVEIAGPDGIEDGVKAFMDRRRRHEEWRGLEERAIPAARRALQSDEWLTAQRSRVAALREGVSAGGRAPWDAMPTGRPEDRRRRAAECEAEVRALNAEIHAGEQKMSAFLEREQPRMAGLLTTREDLERHLQRAREFEEAVTVAQGVLDEVSRETFASWSVALNDLAADLIPRLHPGLAEVRFLEDLGLSVRMPGGRELSRDESAAQLSAGARDQLALVVRVAVSEYLSRGEVLLPIVLDDPFARTDDERFATAFRFLVDHCAGKHQLLVFSCHEARHAALESADPGWFAERVSRCVMAAVERGV